MNDTSTIVLDCFSRRKDNFTVTLTNSESQLYIVLDLECNTPSSQLELTPGTNYTISTNFSENLTCELMGFAIPGDKEGINVLVIIFNSYIIIIYINFRFKEGYYTYNNDCPHNCKSCIYSCNCTRMCGIL